GSLLSDGIGDTIRVSLTEDSVHEIPVARALVAQAEAWGSGPVTSDFGDPLSFDPFTYRRRATERIEIDSVPLGGEETLRVFTTQNRWDALAHKIDRLGDYKPELVLEQSGAVPVD